MVHFNTTLSNLESFIRRYHFSAVIKGVLLFLGFGLLYAIFWVFVEHLFWLSTLGRTVVFWSLVMFESFLFYRFVLHPLLRYFKVTKGLSNEEAAILIGTFFPEIKDKLLNTIQLNRLEKTELLLASVEQKALEFNSFSFVNAVNLKDNLRYLKYTLAPFIVLAPFYLFGNQNNIENSLKRVVNYNTAYSPPAPFVFKLNDDSLTTIENTSFTLQVTTQGSILPEEVQIVLNGQAYYLNKQSNNQFEFEFSQPKQDQKFQLVSGDVISETYTLTVVKAPQILSQKLHLNFPAHTNLKSKDVSSFSNIVVPEGTRVSWAIQTAATDTVALVANKQTFFLDKKGDEFSFAKRLFSNFKYILKTSNSNLKDYETLESKIEVKPDQPPKLNLQVKEGDQIKAPLYFYGQMSDDYGVSKVLLHYAPTSDKDDQTTVEITSFNKDRLDFFYTFPNALELVPDTSYQLYFEVLDTDPFPNPNSTRSALFYYDFKSENRIEQERLNAQQDALQDLENKLSNSPQKASDSEPIRMLRQKDKLGFNDRQNIRAILERQEQQNTVMQRFTKKMSQSLDDSQKSQDKSDERKKLLQRLENQKKRSEETKKELEDLRELMNKLNKEELLERVEKLSQKNQTNQRSLEQMLELTKRYYVAQKAAQLQQKLSTLAKEQDRLSEQLQDKNTPAKQKEVNQAFNALSKALDDLRKRNRELTKPISVPDTKKEERSISENQKNALEILKQKKLQNDLGNKSNLNKKAQKEQRKAAQKMMQISDKMSQQMSSGGQQQLQEDVAMLRQILDNLLLFSFEQEDLMQRFKSNSSVPSLYAKNLIYQNNLKTHFEHIDDSLFVLSLRQPLVSERINTEVENINSNMDKALRLFSENDTYKATGAQQYVITSTNSLADLLSNALNSMEMQLQMSPGQGQGEMQLPDIIMSQEALKQQAEEFLKGQEEEDNEGSESGSGTTNSGESKNQDSPTQQQGSSGKDSPNGGLGDSEESSEALFQLYQKQQALRKALSDLLQQKGQNARGKSTIDAMEKLEQLLLNQGVTKKTMAQMQALKYQYLKLDKAIKKQGIEQKRTARFNTQDFKQSSDSFPSEIKRLFNAKDVLNRQSLPLRQSLNQRVINYFKKQYD